MYVPTYDMCTVGIISVSICSIAKCRNPPAERRVAADSRDVKAVAAGMEPHHLLLHCGAPKR